MSKYWCIFMIIYFADRQLNILGQASTELPEGLTIREDIMTIDIETGAAIFECRIPYDSKTRALVESCAANGNYLLRSTDNENEFYTIIDTESDTKKQEIYIYAEDAGMDLLNVVVGAYEADKAYPISHYIDMYAAGSGFQIGINEAKSLTRKLSWDSEATAAERILSVATQFDGCEISYSFDIDGLVVKNKYINIYKERGKDSGIQLRLNKEIDSIITTKSIANLATALQCTGGTPDQSTTILEATSSDGSPKVAYEVTLSTLSRTASTVKINATVTAALTSESAELADDYGLTAAIYMGGSWHSKTIKATDKDNKQKWSGTTRHSTEYTFTVSGIAAGVIKYTDIKFKATGSGTAGTLASTACGEFIVPNYIQGGENGENINDRPITLEGYSYDDKDFYVVGNVLKSRTALKQWSRFLWKNDDETQQGGHITKQFSYDTLNQQELCKKAITELKKLREMEVNYDVDIKRLPDNVKIGDRVNIIDDEGELYLSTRILTIERSVTDQTHRAVLGEHLIKTSGISQKIADLAAQFAKLTVSSERALKYAKTAKMSAEAAQTQADAALTAANEAKTVVDSAIEAADTATQSAQAAQEAADKAQAAVDAFESDVASIQETVDNANAAAEQAQQAAATAQTKAEEAHTAATNAQTKAEEVETQLEETKASAEAAEQNAATAKTTAEQAKADAQAASSTAAAAKADAEQAQKDIDALGDNLTTLENTMSADYARKTDLTEATASLQTQITQNAAEISSTASKVTEIDETANNAAELANQAQNAASQAQTDADKAKEDAAAAQTAADNASTAAAAAQSEADTAKAAAATAQSVADKAKTDLEAAQADLATVSLRVDATEEEIAAAEAAVATAQSAADKAQEDAEAAAAKATTAQNTANAAVTDAANAQTAANEAANKANLAQQAADEAKGNAAAAQTKANEAAEAAAAAQETANTAATNAANAQSVADAAAQAAADAQSAADDADARAAQAEADLETAKQNLANVTSRVGATEAEVEAAKADVATAQAAADKAKEDAEAAQSTADTAKANAEAAQTAANNAKTAADTAQAAADEAQAAADKAQADVDKLAVRVTTAETNITQNSEQIALRATKTEVETKLANIKIGGRNLLINTNKGTLNWAHAKNDGESTVEEIATEDEINAVKITVTTPASTWSYGQYWIYETLPKLQPSTDYMLSFDLKTNVSNREFISIKRGNGQALLTNEAPYDLVGDEQWHHYKLPLTTTAYESIDYEHPQVLYFWELRTAGYYIFKNLKLETGNKATDWTPAPEDVDAAIKNTDTALQNTIAEKSAAAVVESEGIMLEALKSYVTSTDYEEFKKSTEADIKVNADNIEMNFNSTTERISKVDGELQSELTERKKHITYGADNAIFIGGSLSGITLTVDNDNGIIFSRIISRTDSESGATEVSSSSIQDQLHTSKETAPTGVWQSTLPEMSNSEYLWIRKTITYTDNTTCITDSVAFGTWNGDDFYTGNIIIRVDEKAQFGDFAYFPRADKSLVLRKVGG